MSESGFDDQMANFREPLDVSNLADFQEKMYEYIGYDVRNRRF